MKVKQFTISTNDRRQKQFFKDVLIKPKDDKVFVFFDAKEYDEFIDDLRQTFEAIFPFGCSVSSKICNEVEIEKV